MTQMGTDKNWCFAPVRLGIINMIKVMSIKSVPICVICG